jgi:hypothetical protein
MMLAKEEPVSAPGYIPGDCSVTGYVNIDSNSVAVSGNIFNRGVI